MLAFEMAVKAKGGDQIMIETQRLFDLSQQLVNVINTERANNDFSN